MHQIISRPRPDLAPDNSSNTRSQVIVITAISLFALAGFLLGFTAGALNRPSHTAVQPPPQKPKPIVSQHPSPTQTQTVEQKVRLGCPIVNWPTDNTMIADGSTNYTFTAQAVDKSIDNATPCRSRASLAGSGSRRYLIINWSIFPLPYWVIRTHSASKACPARSRAGWPTIRQRQRRRCATIKGRQPGNSPSLLRLTEASTTSWY